VSHNTTQHIKDLLTDCEVCTGKYCLRFFEQTERRKSEVCAIKTEGNTFPYTDRANEVNIGDLLYGFIGSQFVLTLYILAVSGGALDELLITTKQLIKILQRKKLIFKNITFFHVFVINIQQKFYVK
jgi:hypothetical protein